MVIDQQRRLGGTRSHPEVCPRRGRRHPPARGSRHHTNAHKEGFYHRPNAFNLLPPPQPFPAPPPTDPAAVQRPPGPPPNRSSKMVTTARSSRSRPIGSTS